MLPPTKLPTIPLDPEVCQKASRYATRVCQEMTKRSSLIKNLNDNHCIPFFSSGEVLPFLGDKLGKGGFNSVYELERIELYDNNELDVADNEDDESNTSSSSEDDNNDDSDGEDVPKRQHRLRSQRRMRRRVARKVGNTPFAVKFLNETAMSNPNEFCNGAADLLLEAKYLSALASNHPHQCIITLHGIAAEGASGFSSGQMGGYFLIVDRLYETLDKKIDIWKELRRRKLRAIVNLSKSQSDPSSRDSPPPSPSSSSGSNTEAISMNFKMLQALWLQRVQVALDISSAIRHLHRLSIVFRDLKPDNVGFDINGTVKLFDFGLAKELDPLQRTADGRYEMSGGTGSRRFMAPEVALGEPYDLSADIYSFSILLWELVALEKAFGKLSQDEHKDQVLRRGERPPLRNEWTPAMVSLLQQCWPRDPAARVSAKELFRLLKQQVTDVYQYGFSATATSADSLDDWKDKRLCL